MSLPYLTEQEREAEWLDAQSLYKKLGEAFTASLARVAAAYVADEKGLSRRQWQLGELLSEGELEWRSDVNEYWELVTGFLYETSGGWLAFSQSTLKYYARTANRCQNVPGLDKYQQVMPFAFFAAAGEMVNSDKYDCANIAEPLAWALARYVDGNTPTVSDMRSAFAKDAGEADPWIRFVGGFSAWATELDYLPDNTKARLAPHVKGLRAEIERLERGEK